MNEEIWKPIPGLPGFEVSNLGNARSLARDVNRNGKVFRKITGRVLSKYTNPKHGYVTVAIKFLGGGRPERLHRLVAMAFIPNPQNLPSVDHIDFNKQNNRAENLQWISNEENALKTYRAGRGVFVRGSKHGVSKLKESDVVQIRLMGATHKRSELAKMFMVSANTIGGILTNRIWTHVPLPEPPKL